MGVSLKLVDLQKNYRAVEALNFVSLELKGGKVIVLLGVNGSGKTTILRVITRLIKPMKGRIYLDDKDIHSLDHRKTYFVCTIDFPLGMQHRQRDAFQADGVNLPMFSTKCNE